MLILYTNFLSSKIAESFATCEKHSYGKDTATHRKQQTEICGKVTRTKFCSSRRCNDP